MAQPTNHAAVLTGPKAPLTVQELPLYTPAPNELLVRNEFVAINPVEYKIAKLGNMPLEYPAILGSTFCGIIEDVGSDVKGFELGERVVVSKRFGVKGNQYGAWQGFVVVADRMIAKIEDKKHAKEVASVMMNATCVPGLFTGRLGLDRPPLNGEAVTKKDKKILIYGGSSSFGRLAIRYLSAAGYTVVTTSSPRNHASVSQLGAAKVVDHTADPEVVKEQLLSLGPYGFVIDMISLPSTLPVTTSIVASQGGGKLYVMNPVKSEVEGVECVFEPWSDSLYAEENGELLKWVKEEYLLSDLVLGQEVEKVEGGLAGIEAALERMGGGEGGRFGVEVLG